MISQLSSPPAGLNPSIFRVSGTNVVDDWKGDVNALVKQLNDYPIEGLKEVIVVHNGSVQSIYP